MQGWVDLGTVVRRSPCQRLHIAVAVAINTTVHSEIQTWVLSHCSRMGALTTKPVWPASLELCSTATHTTEYRQLQAAFSRIMYSSSSTRTRTQTYPFNSPLSGTTQVSRYQKGKNQSGFYWSKRQWVAVVSAGSYASLHLAPDR